MNICNILYSKLFHSCTFRAMRELVFTSLALYSTQYTSMSVF